MYCILTSYYFDSYVFAGKDNRTICWNPTAGEIMYELPSSTNWNIDVQVDVCVARHDINFCQERVPVKCECRPLNKNLK